MTDPLQSAVTFSGMHTNHPQGGREMSSAKSFVIRRARVLAVAVSCAGLGAGASVIANAGAASSSPTRAAHSGHPAAAARLGALRRAMYGGAVQGNVVVDTKSGWKTVSFERGFIDSVSGNSLTLREATRKATYETVTLTIPDSAVVRSQGQRVSLSQLTAGEHVLVLRGPARTFVIARSPATR
jgi:hypothetical protein